MTAKHDFFIFSFLHIIGYFWHSHRYSLNPLTKCINSFIKENKIQTPDHIASGFHVKKWSLQVEEGRCKKHHIRRRLESRNGGMMGNVCGFSKRNGSCSDSPVCSPTVENAAFPPPVSPTRLTFAWCLWQLSNINYLVSSVPGGAEALKWSDLVSFSCPCFLSQPMTVCWTCSYSPASCTCDASSLRLGEAGKPCCVSLHVVLPARRVSAGSYCPQLICYRDWVDAWPASHCEKHEFACVSGSCCCWKATWITKGQLFITEY